MTAITDPPKETFRLSMLLYDTRYRSLTIQVIALICFMLVIAWLVDNAATNLAALGKPLSFGFLGEIAGYDINQRLIEYNSQMTHGRAALVGILNTLLVALLGCITATIIGVFAGVLRLSNNWIVARIMSVYVEGFRNVPVLLWIVAIFAVVSETLPAPRAFRGDDATAHMLINDSVALTNRGFYIPKPIFESGSMIVVLTFILSIVGIVFFRKWAKARQEATGEIMPVGWISLAIFFLPTLFMFYIMGRPIVLEYPELAGFNFKGGIHMRNSLIALWLALSLYTGAFIAETVRSGIQAVSKGQTEAAGALGLRGPRIMRLVVLPQAMRVIIPPMISQYLNLTKNSSLAIAVGYMDATGTLGGITLNQTGREMECVLLLMLFYLITSLAISAVMNWYNAAVKLKER
ncbi:amino acid ABC transporter permease [Oceanomicrobium pacificus]|uniref:ABC transporter permease subunit n=1 Tax=Oceanomicrobium pacificus TaxID=2692916 RepID=A0A6B0TXI7_9RHOB|nr:ABC transporter permease subunit [Oceanomicrobium pacificus]MXU66415.1 ABC transporter permease subunit [Oceanomicrobium pacificus]